MVYSVMWRIERRASAELREIGTPDGRCEMAAMSGPRRTETP